MKKHLTVLLCSIALSCSSSIHTVGIEDTLRAEGMLAQTLEKELATLRQSEQVMQERIRGLQQLKATRSMQEIKILDLDKRITRERKKLSQLKRSRARLLLKQASELE